MRIAVLYRHACPECGGAASFEELASLGKCSNCSNTVEGVALRVWWSEVEDLTRFFIAAVGSEPWSLQRYWIKRLVSGESFALIAPTGIGKSTLLAVYALYRAYLYGWKVYILTPTIEIAKQFYAKIREYMEKLRNVGYLIEVRVLIYDSSKSAKSVKEAIARGEFDILITSAGFLSRNYDILTNLRFDLVIADDLDALLRESRNVEKILKLLGFSDQEIELATKLAKLKQNLAAAKLANQQRYEELKAEVIELEAKLRSIIAEKRAQFVVASATGRVRGLKPLILRELLGFEGGALFEYWRNIVDVYAGPTARATDLIPVLIKVFRTGIIFISSENKHILKEITKILELNNVRYAIAKSGTRAVDKFRRGEVDVVIGSASYYGILVRGLDEPLRVRFVVFIGIPKILTRLDRALTNIRTLYAVLRTLKELGEDVSEELNIVRSVIERSSPGLLIALKRWLREAREIPSNFAEVVANLRRVIAKCLDLAKKVLREKGTFRVASGIVKTIDGEPMIIKPDPYTYIQASGRSSRLLGGKKTFGVSILFEDSADMIKLLELRMRRLVPEFTVKQFSEVDLLDLARRVEESRKSSHGETDIRRAIRTCLLVVESPTKAKTIANMFGRSSRRIVGGITVYEGVIPVSRDKIYVATIAATLGHITDLVTDEGLHGIVVDGNRYVPIYDYIARCRSCGKQFVGIYEACPYCGSSDIVSSYTVVNALRKIALDVDEVLIGTDPDFEGEKIAFDVATLLLPVNRRIMRVEFHEVTRRAVLEALANPRPIMIKRVEAQIVRRIVDRWIGFELSSWVQQKLGKPWLGIGRVQTPVLLWVVDRYDEYRNNYGYLLAIDIHGYRVRIYIGRGSEARRRAEDLAKKVVEHGLKVVSYEIYEREVPPPPPFTTDELLYEAGTRLGLTPSKTMSIAQTLFEAGLITYHRTDSTYVSSVGIHVAKEALEKHGLGSLFVARSWGTATQGAHECIRPTSPMSAEDVRDAVLRGELGVATRISELHLKVYDLIYRRFLASQMKSAKVRYVRATLEVFDGYRIEIDLPVEIVDLGHTAVYPIKLYREVLDEIVRGCVKPREVKVVRGSTARLYTASDLVKMLKERGIGRPSTYAKAVDNNVRHGYIVFSKRKKFAIPTKLGIEVSNIVKSNFLELVGEPITRELEKIMDAIEQGNEDPVKVLNLVLVRIKSYVESAQIGIDVHQHTKTSVVEVEA